MSDIVTIQEDFILPSKGMMNGEKFDPHVRLRSMTVADEMKRLSPSNEPYKQMCDIIDDCLLDKLPVSTYDLCFGDYVYLLQKLRIVTYGSKYSIQYRCPKCGSICSKTIDLSDLKVREFDESIKSMMTIELPETKKTVKLRFQTPKDLDRISLKVADYKKEHPESNENISTVLNLSSFIDSISGELIDKVALVDTLKKLPMKDANILAKKAIKLNEMVGIDTTIDTECDFCHSDVKVPFRYTSEFFGPEVD